MSNKLKINVFTLSIIIVVILFVFDWDRINPSQDGFTRSYKKNNYKLLNSFEYPFVTYKIKVFNKKIYLWDGTYQKIHEIDLKSGKIIQSFGKGRGRGPAEFDQIGGWRVTDDTLFAFAAYKGAIQVLHGDSLINYFKVKERTKVITYLGNQEFIAFQKSPETNKEFNYVIINIKERSSSRVDVKHPNGVFGSFSLIGRFIENDNGNHIYVCDRLGYFISFSSRGRFLYSNKTIDKSPYVAPNYMGEDAQMLDKTFNVKNVHSTIDDTKFYIVSRVEEESANWGRWRPIDTYRIEDGKYQYSFQSPHHPDGNTILFRIAMYSDHILLATDMEKIYVFEYKFD